MSCYKTLKTPPNTYKLISLHLLKKKSTTESGIFMSGELRNLYNMTNRWFMMKLSWSDSNDFLKGVITQLFGR